MEHLALTIFSICVQAAVGTMVFLALAKLVNKEAIFKTALVTAAGLAIVGLLASLLHLGQPLSALNALAKFGSSWLSREIWLTGAFTGLTVISALLMLFKPAAKSAINALVVIAGLIGLADVYIMASIYHFASVPAWQHGSIYVEFYAAAISMGAVLFLALSPNKAANMRKIAVLATGIAIACQVVAMIIYYIELGANSSLAARQSINLLSTMDLTMMIKWAFILVGAGLLLFPVKNQEKVDAAIGKAAMETAVAGEAVAGEAGNNDGGIYLAAAVLIIGQLLGRYLFYAVMVISRVGLS